MIKEITIQDPVNSAIDKAINEETNKVSKECKHNYIHIKLCPKCRNIKNSSLKKKMITVNIMINNKVIFTRSAVNIGMANSWISKDPKFCKYEVDNGRYLGKCTE